MTRRGRPTLGALLVALPLLGAVAAASDLARRWSAYTAPEPLSRVALAARLLALAAAALLAWRVGRRGVAPLARLSPALLARLFLYGAAVGLLGPSLVGDLRAGDDRLISLFWSCALLGSSLVLRVGLAERLPRPARSLRVLDVAAANLLLLLVLGELAFRLVQRAAPSQLLWDESSAAGSVLALRRCEPPLWFRYRCNSRGYPDEEFFEPGPDDYAVALIADSFGSGSVPWEHHFATLAERELREHLGARFARVDVQVFGVTGADLPEYRYLLDTEIRGRPFAQVVLCVFVGTDFYSASRAFTAGPLARLVRIQDWLAPEVARRTWRVLSGVERLVPPGDVDLDREPAFLRDPSLEPPYFTPEKFLEIETERMRFALSGGTWVEAGWREGLAVLAEFHRTLGRQLLIALIPDEFQVNDALWEQLLPRAIERYAPRTPPVRARALFDRENPQERIRAWAAKRGARVVDLLPALRAAEREGRTYHLRDTHWNARGNTVAGGVLARALIEHAEAGAAPAAAGRAPDS
jgi:hypothetical protein